MVKSVLIAAVVITSIATTDPAPVKNPESAPLEAFTVTAYCGCSACCGESTGITATGTQATEGRTIGVDPSVIPLGSKVEIEDLGTYIAEDTGSGVVGNHIDLYFDNHDEALAFGVQTREVNVK